MKLLPIHTLAAFAADMTLWLIAALHVLCALSLVLVLSLASRAHATEKDVACGGLNLVSQMEKERPELAAALRDQAQSIPNAKGIFWKVEKDGLAPSWLLGTMHVTDERVLKMPPGADAALAAASTVIVESDEIVDDRKAAAAMLSRPDLTMFTDGKTISDFLDADDQKLLTAGLKERGIPMSLVARMKPWMIAGFVALPACEAARKAAGASFLDKKLAEEAIRDGKTLKGLESLVEQLDAMNSLPAEFHLQALIETLALGDTIRDVMETTTQLYLSGDTGMILPMMKAVSKMKTGADDPASAEFEERIITQRNRTMAVRAAPILNQGNVFMAVGALHLPGEEGLIELLRKEGFMLTLADQG